MFPVNLQGVGNWEIVYSQHLSLVGNAKSLEPIEIPVQAESRYIIVGTSLSTAKPTWFTAGYLTQFIGNLSIDSAAIFPHEEGFIGNTVDISTKRISLNAIQLVVFPDLSSAYSLFFSPVSWLKSLDILIWQFTGTETRELDLLTNIQNQLNNLSP